MQSSTLVIAYLIKFKSMTFLNALKLCKSKRPHVCPNLGFELQLKAYEKMLQTSLLVEQKKKLSKELPELTKYQPFSTFNKSFMR
jgi:serine/threonine/tyrosine-interacting protein